MKPHEIWEKATPLNEAWLRWATDKNREDYNEKLSSQSYDEIPKENLLASMGHIFRNLQNDLNRPKRLLELMEVMRRDLIGWLTEEEYYAYGSRVLPKPAKNPRLISCDFWSNAEIVWEKEIAEDAVLKFQRIRIIDPYEFTEIEDWPKIGRPTYKPHIYSAIKEILKNDPNFQNKKNADKLDKIWNRLKVNYPKLVRGSPGLGEDAVRKIMNSFFRENFWK